MKINHRRTAVFQFSSCMSRSGVRLGALPWVLTCAATVGICVLSCLERDVLPLVGLLLIGLVWLRASRIAATVGSDGISLLRPWRSSFVAYSTIADIEFGDGEIVIALNDRRSLRMSFPRTRWSRLFPAGLAPADRTGEFATLVRHHLHERRAATQSTGVLPPRLARAGRPVKRWMADLRGMLGVSGGYRELAIVRENLWCIVENAGVVACARAAAAAALQDKLDERERYRLRATARACAEPDLRNALEAAAASDDARLTRALASLSTVGSRRRERCC